MFVYLILFYCWSVGCNPTEIIKPTVLSSQIECRNTEIFDFYKNLLELAEKEVPKHGILGNIDRINNARSNFLNAKATLFLKNFKLNKSDNLQKYHPDKFPGDSEEMIKKRAEAEGLFKKIQRLN